MEYAAEHLHSPLLVVMGHESCGAVKAAADTKPGAASMGPNLDYLVKSIQPAFDRMATAGRRAAHPRSHPRQRRAGGQRHPRAERASCATCQRRGRAAARRRVLRTGHGPRPLLRARQGRAGRRTHQRVGGTPLGGRHAHCDRAGGGPVPGGRRVAAAVAVSTPRPARQTHTPASAGARKPDTRSLGARRPRPGRDAHATGGERAPRSQPKAVVHRDQELQGPRRRAPCTSPRRDKTVNQRREWAEKAVRHACRPTNSPTRLQKVLDEEADRRKRGLRRSHAAAGRSRSQEVPAPASAVRATARLAPLEVGTTSAGGVSHVRLAVGARRRSSSPPRRPVGARLTWQAESSEARLKPQSQH